MARLTVNFKPERFLRGLATFEGRFHQAMEKAVLDSARIGVSRIIQESDKEAPPPPVRFYVRTDELVSGWKPAADRLGIAAKSAKPTAENPNSGYGRFNSSPEVKEFIAGNTSEHAFWVEYAGTWKTPFPERRQYPGGYQRATNVMKDMNEKEILNTLARGEWIRLLA